MPALKTMPKGAMRWLVVFTAVNFFVTAHEGRHVVTRAAPPEVELQLYFINPNLPEWANSCSAGEFVKRKVATTKRPAHTALTLLFAGPTAEEKTKGMQTLAPLGNYYLGVSIKKGVAIVNFKLGAEKYLHVSGAFCEQEQVLTPIIKTLKQFATIKSVDYAINGKIIKDWDA